MNANAAIADVEIVTVPIGNGRRVRILNGERLRIVGDAGPRRDDDERTRRSPSRLIAKLKALARRR